MKLLPSVSLPMPFLSLCLTIMLLQTAITAQGDSPSRISETEQIFVTYPFSDPDPIPVFGKIYPYFRFDGFTNYSVPQKWKVVTLENDYLRVEIMPQIGGKVWSAFDKTTNQEILYHNKVVKFRDISMRGPWTSGGIEFNYGVVGHAPTCSTPVDYLLRINPDSSASCIIRMLDLLTRSVWSVDICLPADKAWFSTSSFWHNSSGLWQPYYNWANSAVTATDDLEFIYPGTNQIAHDGTAFEWPLNRERGKNLALWRENDFISSKSYHILGSYSNYFGAYWHNTKQGMLHYSPRDDKAGKKLFSWALSDQGKIWEELLTDYDGQYVELQSGRLFNQNMTTSVLTPFKQTGFAPYSTDTWDEYWFGYNNTDGVSNATLTGVIHIQDETGEISISPLCKTNGILTLQDDNGQEIALIPVTFEPGKIWRYTPIQKAARILFNDEELWNNDHKTLSRPLKSPQNFVWESAYGNYLRGRDLAWLRNYRDAEVYALKSLSYDSCYLPTLNLLSQIAAERLDYEQAFRYALQALSIDTYDAEANYLAGYAALLTGRIYDALDCFEIAALSSSYRSAAYTRLAEIYLIRKEYKSALNYAHKSLLNNANNLEGLRLGYLAADLGHNSSEASSLLTEIEAKDPLSHFAAFERYFSAPDITSAQHFTSRIRNEMAIQTYLELAIRYHTLQLDDRARAVLALAPNNAETAYWQAYLAEDSTQRYTLLAQADTTNVLFVFPFRPESAPIFEWAASKSGNWRSRYLLALIHAFRGNDAKALCLLQSTRDMADFAPLYVTRARLNQSNPEAQEADLQKAATLDPNQWRYVHALTRFYLGQQRNLEALKTIQQFYTKHSTHFPTGMLYIRTLMRCNHYSKAEKILANTYILPFEGAKDGFLLQQQIKLMQAADLMQRNRNKEALAKIDQSRLWPRNLGVGKPYDEVIDNRLTDWFAAIAHQRTGNTEKAEKLLQRIAYPNVTVIGSNTLFQSAALYLIGHTDESTQLFQQWEAAQPKEAKRHEGRKIWETACQKDFASDSALEHYLPVVRRIADNEDIRLF